MGRKFISPDKAAFKLWVSFKDGGKANLASRDWKGKKYVPWEGLLMLERYVMNKSDRIKTAVIYDKRGGRDYVCRKYSGGSWTVWTDVDFT
ncbi:MAG: hypothetical protein AAF998_02760 [Bacteroidota bacterium]